VNRVCVLRDDCQWMNFRWAIDVHYTHVENCPILAKLVEQYKLFWDGEYCYVRQKSFILRFPDWRNNYRVDLEAWKRHHKITDPKQKTLI
jgi:hypothetical protein